MLQVYAEEAAAKKETGCNQSEAAETLTLKRHCFTPLSPLWVQLSPFAVPCGRCSLHTLFLSLLQLHSNKLRKPLHQSLTPILACGCVSRCSCYVLCLLYEVQHLDTALPLYVHPVTRLK